MKLSLDFLKRKEKTTQDGRKYRMALVFAGLMFLGLGLAAKGIVNESLYSTFLTGLGALYFTFCGHNVGEKWVHGKNGTLRDAMRASGELPRKPPQEEEDPKDPPAGAP